MRFFRKKPKPPKMKVLRYDVGDDTWYQEGFATWEEAEARRSEIEDYMKHGGETFRSSHGYLINSGLIKRIWINDVW